MDKEQIEEQDKEQQSVTGFHLLLQAVAKEQIEDIEGKDKEQFPVAGFGCAAVAAGAQIW